MLLRLPRLRRLSIDADIICELPLVELDSLLAKVGRTKPFVQVAEDDRGAHRVPARRHFKFYYESLDVRNPAPFVLLDVVHERNLYPKVESVALRKAFIEGDTSLMVPTIEGLLGDKLTAFGPETTGIPLDERNSMQFMKQLFDIGELFNAAHDLAEVAAAYEAIFAAENGYRGGNFTKAQALQDAFDTAYCIAQVGLKGARTDGRCEQLEIGRRQLESHLVGTRFRREDMKIAAAKAALLTQALNSGMPLDALRYDQTKIESLRTLAFPDQYAALRRLKAVPEALWYWSLATRSWPSSSMSLTARTDEGTIPTA
ncbi:MAG: nucleotidyl transferase AbiEii/AbiGii toxin family protein [Rectinemataceae bacterium]